MNERESLRHVAAELGVSTNQAYTTGVSPPFTPIIVDVAMNLTVTGTVAAPIPEPTTATLIGLRALLLLLSDESLESNAWNLLDTDEAAEIVRVNFGLFRLIDH